jgi:hypothetical protein
MDDITTTSSYADYARRDHLNVLGAEVLAYIIKTTALGTQPLTVYSSHKRRHWLKHVNRGSRHAPYVNHLRIEMPVNTATKFQGSPDVGKRTSQLSTGQPR